MKDSLTLSAPEGFAQITYFREQPGALWTRGGKPVAKAFSKLLDGVCEDWKRYRKGNPAPVEDIFTKK